MSPAPTLTPPLALDYLRELSADIRSGVVLDPKGALLGQYDLSHMRYLFLAGERLDPETYHWASDLLGIPVIDHW